MLQFFLQNSFQILLTSCVSLYQRSYEPNAEPSMLELSKSEAVIRGYASKSTILSRQSLKEHTCLISLSDISLLDLY